MSIADFVKGNKNFLKVKFKENEKIYNKLIKEGQSPKALFIGCSDSRVLPETIVAANPGDLFIVRNIGNFVPPYKPDNDFHATAAAIEYAVNVLNVEHIIVCGHSHCGACAALYQNLDDKPELMHVKKWLELGQKAKEQAIKIDGGSAATTERVSLIFQSKNLLTYPFIKQKIEENKLFLHAWYYRLEDGVIEFYDEEKNEFLILNEENI
jgi:carbonic anhydrase